MVGFKSKNQESQKGKQLVVVILIWGEKKTPTKNPNQNPKPANQENLRKA